jgi:uncharacterized membrane protein YedE/YeeE
MKNKGFWPPYRAGVILGLTLLAVFVVMGRGLGASGAFALVAAVGLNAVSPGYAGVLQYFSQYLDSPMPLMNVNLFLVVGVLLGALSGALFSGKFKVEFDKADSMSAGTRFFTALAGGVLMGFAARLARGCTSGVALTGGAQLAVSGWVFVIAMFAAGFAFAAIFRRFWS